LELIRATVLLGALVAALGAAAALADGDPASDVLYARNVFLPFPAPRADAAAAIQTQVDAVYQHGYRIKVAVIASPNDLGAVPSLFGKPADYAHFLGAEIRTFFIGPLLVVMPAGFGIYDGGRSTSAEEQVLKSLQVTGQSADDLTSSATTAVGRLLGAGVLHSKDILAPLAFALPSLGKRGRRTALKYLAFDDSGRVGVVIQVFAGRLALATFRLPLRSGSPTQTSYVAWRVPLSPPSPQLQFCVTATDPSGNRSRRKLRADQGRLARRKSPGPAASRAPVVRFPGNA
jgi:hypothetical protein